MRNEKHLYLVTQVFIQVGAIGFEPMKAKPADLQSAPFDHSGILPMRCEKEQYKF